MSALSPEATATRIALMVSAAAHWTSLRSGPGCTCQLLHAFAIMQRSTAAERNPLRVMSQTYSRGCVTLASSTIFHRQVWTMQRLPYRLAVRPDAIVGH